MKIKSRDLHYDVIPETQKEEEILKAMAQDNKNATKILLNSLYGKVIYADTDSVVDKRKYTIKHWLGWIMIASIFTSVILFFILLLLIFCF